LTVKLPLPKPPVLVVGLGRAGNAALQSLVAANGAEGIAAWDAQARGNVRVRAAYWRSRGVRVMLGGDGLSSLEASDSRLTIVKSPGIDMDVPLLRAATEFGLEILDELEIGWRMYSTPLVAVTGTNGKSTTCSLIASILSAVGHKTELVGNTEFGSPLSGAMPGTAIVCEVSSFQLEASPTFLPEFAVFTNLSPEHLTRHKTMEAYGSTKQRMFVRGDRTCGVAIVNTDDAWGRRIIAAVRCAGGRVVTYGSSPDADIRIIDARWTMQEAETLIALGNTRIAIHSRLPGRYNALNIAAAVAFGTAAGLGQDAIVKGVEATVPPAGRCELIDEGQPFDVVVDYAHTPDGIAQFLQAAHAVTTARGSTLRTVFGAVGLPDPPKARGCGEAAAAFSDQLILTTGTAPRSPRIVRMRELLDAARSTCHIDLVLDRRKAIEKAIAQARAGDVVAILGLGALNRLILDASGTVCPFDDRREARVALQSREPCAL